jgi:hypothetical protein
MAQAIPQQHPAVVLRSHYAHLRALLAVAMLAVVALSAAVAILATSAGERDVTARPTQVTVTAPNGARYDGGPEEGTRGALSTAAAVTVAPGTRFDGGPEEGTRGPRSANFAPSVRYDGGPDEGTRGLGH